MTTPRVPGERFPYHASEEPRYARGTTRSRYCGASTLGMYWPVVELQSSRHEPSPVRTITVEQRAREWVVRRGDVTVSLHPSRVEAERAAEWLRAHDGQPAVASVA